MIKQNKKYPQQSYRKTAILVALLFLSSTLTFSIGSSLIDSFFSGKTDDVSQLLTGVFLEIYTGLAVAGIGLAMLPILKMFRKNLAYSYLAFRALECLVIVFIGTYFISTENQLQNYALIIYSFTGIGGIILSYLLYVSKIVSKMLSVLGIVGYIVLTLGIPADLLGITDLNSNSGYIFFIPGGLFELLLPIWLLIKGFSFAKISPQTKPKLKTA